MNKTTIYRKGTAKPVKIIEPAIITPHEIRQAIRQAAKAEGTPVDQYVLINSGLGQAAQVFYIELRKEK